MTGYWNPAANLKLSFKMARRNMDMMPVDWPEYYLNNIKETDSGLLVYEPTILEFGEADPCVFYESEGGLVYRGQENQKARIDMHIKSLKPGERRKMLLSGSAGTGKTALARIIVRRMMEHIKSMGLTPGEYYEILPNQIENKEQLDSFMSQLEEYDMVFIDEIHVLKQLVGVEPLYHTLDDTGAPRYPLGDGKGWLSVPTTVSWISATTDPGKLDDTTGGALRRRLQPEIILDEPDEATIKQIILDRRETTTTDAAADAIAKRSGRLPWQAILVWQEARNVSRVSSAKNITIAHANKAFELMELDERGLFPQDRKVIAVLLQSPYTLRSGPRAGEVVYRMSQPALSQASGVDTRTYIDQVQPKLMRMGYLTTAWGQMLTDTALRDYGHLKTAFRA